MKPRYYLMLSLAWLGMIWLLSSLPSRDLPSVNIFGIDKLAHFGAYLIWGLLTHLYFYKKGVAAKHRSYLYVLMFLLSAFDEYHQRWIPGRDVSVYDLAANWVGLTASFLTLRFIRRMKR